MNRSYSVIVLALCLYGCGPAPRAHEIEYQIVGLEQQAALRSDGRHDDRDDQYARDSARARTICTLRLSDGAIEPLAQDGQDEIAPRWRQQPCAGKWLEDASSDGGAARERPAGQTRGNEGHLYWRLRAAIE
jgi:hypothetical protein